MNAFRWIARAFFSRIGWVLAGLLLMWLGLGKAHASQDCSSYWYPGGNVTPNITCPSGQHVDWGHMSSYPSGPIVWGDGSAVAACNAAATAAGRAGFYFHVFADGSSYTCVAGTLSTGQCNSLANTTSVDMSNRCVASTCNLPANTRQGWAVSGAPASACIGDCVVTLRDGIDFGLGGPVPKYYSTTGATCSGQAAGSVEPSRDKCDGGVCGDVDTGEVTDNTVPLLDGTNAQAVSEQGCVTTESGGVFCIVSAPNDLRPDNGTPGTPATPDQTISVPPPLNGQASGSSTTINYYNSTTVSNSTNLGGASTDGDGSDSSGECASGDTECEGGGRGDGRVHGSGMGTAKTVGASAGSLWNAVQGSPLGSAVGGISAGMPSGGTCPAITFTVPIIGSVSSDLHCQIWTSTIAPILSAVFLAIWGIVGVRILMSA